jgi:ribose transport system ATP-binding protein
MNQKVEQSDAMGIWHDIPHGSVVLACEGISKSFGVTRAVSGASIQVNVGELVGVVGHNGAGKSTLLRVVGGLVRPDDGALIVGPQALGQGGYRPKQARALGVRSVHQELSLCSNLTIAEAAILASRDAGRGFRWRRGAAFQLSVIFHEIFPDASFSPRSVIASLSIADRQMIEIATAVLCSPNEQLTCLVLDEPTSSLDADSTSALYRWLRKAARERTFGVLVSTHRLDEVMRELDRVYVMTNGKIVGEKWMNNCTQEELVALMRRLTAEDEVGDAVQPATEQIARDGVAAAGREGQRRSGRIRFSDFDGEGLRGVTLEVNSGEIVGLGGLEGQGQRSIVKAVSRASRWWLFHRRARASLVIEGKVACISGDRLNEGVFKYWDLNWNISVSVMREVARLGLVRPRLERRLSERWLQMLAIKGRTRTPILALSGGTQQKVLVRSPRTQTS